MDFEKLRERVEEAIRAGEYTQTTLADAAGVSQALVSNFVQSKQKTLRITSAEKLARALGLSTGDLGGPKGSNFAYCGSSRCPSVCLAVVAGKFYVAPKFRRLTQSPPENCPYCMCLMYRECPNCRADILEEALYCPECKEPYVPVPDDLEKLPPKDLVRECFLRNRMNEQLRRHLGNDP